HRALEVESARTRADHDVRTAALDAVALDRDLAHRRARADPDARLFREVDLDLAHLAADRARAFFEHALGFDVASGDDQIERRAEVVDLAVAGLDVGVHPAVHPFDADVAGLYAR